MEKSSVNVENAMAVAFRSNTNMRYAARGLLDLALVTEGVRLQAEIISSLRILTLNIVSDSYSLRNDPLAFALNQIC